MMAFYVNEKRQYIEGLYGRNTGKNHNNLSFPPSSHLFFLPSIYTLPVAPGPKTVKASFQHLCVPPGENVIS